MILIYIVIIKMKTENNVGPEKPYNIVVPFNIPGKSDLGTLDLNKIFQVNLNYNFDSLKALLEGLVASYQKTEEEIERLKNNSKGKDIKINKLENKIIDLNVLLSSSMGDEENVAKLQEMKSKLTKEEQNIEITGETEKIPLDQNEENIDKEKNISKNLERDTKTKRILVPKKRKKFHAPLNNDIKLEVDINNGEMINKIIVSINYIYI